MRNKDSTGSETTQCNLTGSKNLLVQVLWLWSCIDETLIFHPEMEIHSFGGFEVLEKHVHRPPPTCAANCSLFHLPWRILLCNRKIKVVPQSSPWLHPSETSIYCWILLLDEETSPKENAIQTAKSTKSEDRLGDFDQIHQNLEKLTVAKGKGTKFPAN